MPIFKDTPSCFHNLISVLPNDVFCFQVRHALDLQSGPQLVCPGGAHGGEAAGLQRKMLLVSSFLGQKIVKDLQSGSTENFTKQVA